MAAAQTLCEPKFSHRCKHTPDTLWLTLCCLCTVERVEYNSPPSSLFMFCTKPPKPNYETPQSLCVCRWEDLLSMSSTYHELHFWEAQSADRWKIENILHCSFKHRQICSAEKCFVGCIHFIQYSIVTTHIPYIFMCSVQNSKRHFVFPVHVCLLSNICECHQGHRSFYTRKKGDEKQTGLLPCLYP